MDEWNMFTYTTRWIMDNFQPLPIITKIDFKYDTHVWYDDESEMEPKIVYESTCDIDNDNDNDNNVDIVLCEESETESEGCDEWDLI